MQKLGWLAWRRLGGFDNCLQIFEELSCGKEIRFVLYVPRGASVGKNSPQYKEGLSNKIRRTLELSKDGMGSLRVEYPDHLGKAVFSMTSFTRESRERRLGGWIA